jgi:glutamate carboxypeptidase
VTAPTTPADLARLPFDADAMLAGLGRWVTCESPTFDAAAVNRMMDIAAFDLAMLGARVERIPGRDGFSDSVLAHLPHPDAGAPGLLVLGHLDTVHPVGTLALLPFRREGNLCFGPGIADMKGGDYLALEAIRQLQAAGIRTPLPVTVLFTGDEEAGSPSTSELIVAIARRHRTVLVPEPARPDGSIVTGRLAIRRFRLTTTGQPSHAGRVPEEGNSAIREMAEQIVAIEAMSDADAAYSVGVVHGGQWSNCVASACSAELLMLVRRHEAVDAAVARLMARAHVGRSVSFSIAPGPARPLWLPDAASLALYRHAAGLAEALGVALPHLVSGGGSDGNFTGAAGVPTLDGLGVRGQQHHTLAEHIAVDSLPERARLFAGLLATLGA